MELKTEWRGNGMTRRLVAVEFSRQPLSGGLFGSAVFAM